MGNVEVLKPAVPPLSFTVPSIDVAVLNVTVPVGTPPPGAVDATVAVNVTGWPYTVGFTEALTEHVDGSRTTH